MKRVLRALKQRSSGSAVQWNSGGGGGGGAGLKFDH